MYHPNPQVQVEDLPSIDQINFTGIDPRYKKVSIITVSIILGILAALYVGAGWIVERMLFEMPILGLVIAGFALVGLPWVYLVIKDFENTGYAIRENDLVYKEGVIFKSTIVVPFNRVQHCEVSQGPISRMMGLSSLTVYTAGGSSSDVSIDGLDKDIAAKLKNFVSGKISVDEYE